MRVAAALSMALAAVGAMAPAGAAEVPASSSAAPPDPAADGALQVLPVNTQLWVGENDLVVELWDTDGHRLDPRLLAGTMTLTGPDGLPRPAVPFVDKQLLPGGPWWAVAPATLDQVGAWQLRVDASGTGLAGWGTAPLAVWPDDGTLPLGAAVPPIRTPTLESSGLHLARITTDPEPEPSFYWTSVDQALAEHRPFVLVIDSVGIRTSDACGSAVAHLRHLQTEFPGLLLIHAEPWVTREEAGRLWIDPVDGPPRPAPWARALGVTAVPWVFVVGGDGRLHAKLFEVFGSDELRAAVRDIAPWAPGGH